MPRNKELLKTTAALLDMCQSWFWIRRKSSTSARAGINCQCHRRKPGASLLICLPVTHSGCPFLLLAGSTRNTDGKGTWKMEFVPIAHSRAWKSGKGSWQQKGKELGQINWWLWRRVKQNWAGVGCSGIGRGHLVEITFERTPERSEGMKAFQAEETAHTKGLRQVEISKEATMDAVQLAG